MIPIRATQFALIATLFVVRRSPAQAAVRPNEAGRLAVASDSVLFTITEAETRANRPFTRVPHDSVPASAIPVFDVGTAERRCVDVGTTTSARSGDFVVGGFSSYHDNWSRGYGKLAWNMVTGSPPVPPMLLVRATRLDAPGEARVFEVEPNRHAPGGPVFYPSGIHVPSPGKWMFVATAGGSWGCFVYALK